MVRAWGEGAGLDTGSITYAGWCVRGGGGRDRYEIYPICWMVRAWGGGQGSIRDLLDSACMWGDRATYSRPKTYLYFYYLLLLLLLNVM